MNIGIIKNGVCIDSAVFDDVQTANKFLKLGVWTNADTVTELPDDFGIGDSLVGGEWIKAPQPESEILPPIPLDPIAELREIVDALLIAQLEGK